MKHRTIIAALALASSVAGAQGFVTGSHLTIAAPTIAERTNAMLRVQAGNGLTLMAIELDGSITLNHGATISFSRETAGAFRRAGPVRYFIPVHVGNELVLLPLYAAVMRRDDEADEQ